VLAACAVGPALVLSVFSGTGGDFPFPLRTLMWCLALCALVGFAWRAPSVRIGCAVYAAVCVAAFALPTPLGGNVTRMPLLFAAPLVVLADRWRWRSATLLPALVLVPVVLGWQAMQIAEVANASVADESTARSYYAGALRFLEDAPGPVRVEIPATSQHWEAAYIGANVAMARGWDRQLDRRLNPEFYDRDRPLDAERYREWLLANSVSFVALPDTTFDQSSQTEARLVQGGLDYLDPVYRNEHWTVYRVAGSRALLDGPGRLIADEGRRIVFSADRSATFTLRVRSFAAWRVDTGSACAGTDEDGWLTVDVASPGRIVLEQNAPLASIFDHPSESCHQDFPTAENVAARVTHPT